MTDAGEEGAAFFKVSPDLLLAAVWHVAVKNYPDNLETQREFVNGYTAARLRHDAYGKEKDGE